MNIITVKHPSGSYPIYLGENGLNETGAYLAELGYRGRCVLVTNEIVGQHHAAPVTKSLQAVGFEVNRIELPDGEQFKTLETVAHLYDQFVEAKIDRYSVVIALGGGVIGDMTGFAAATYLRGLPFVQIPTTLLSMVDASVGGKTGVDLIYGKNLVGAFKQPEMVVMDTHVLTTLPEAEFRSGLGEVIKSGIIDSPALFAALESKCGNCEMEDFFMPVSHSLIWLLSEAVQVKVRVVEEDPFEQGRRAVLNLGHTFAHAFERLAEYKMRHGEAVSIGLVCATRLAVRLGHCSADTAMRIIRLLEQWKLPTQLPPHAPMTVWEAMFTDKKRQDNNLCFVLPQDIGKVDIFKEVPQAEVLAVLSEK